MSVNEGLAAGVHCEEAVKEAEAIESDLCVTDDNDI